MTARRSESGAIIGVVSVYLWIFVIAILAIALEGRATAEFEHTVGAAEAVAHGVAVAANSADFHEQLSIEALSARDCIFGMDQAKPEQKADARLCVQLFGDAIELATMNHVVLKKMIVGPQMENNKSVRPGFLSVAVLVQGNAPFAAGGLSCSDDPAKRSPWCAPLVTGAAEISA